MLRPSYGPVLKVLGMAAMAAVVPALLTAVNTEAMVPMIKAFKACYKAK
jgi:hypothetical protein